MTHPYQNRENEKYYTLIKCYKNTGNTVGKIHPVNKDSTRLQELSPMSNTFFDAID